MAVLSMTGFGSSTVCVDVEGNVYRFHVVAKSVNHRHLDVKLRLGRGFIGLESIVTAKIRGALERGHVELSIEYESASSSSEQTVVDRELVHALYSQVSSLANEVGAPQPTISDILRLPGVTATQRRTVPFTDCEAEILSGIDRALAALVSMRTTEGGLIRQDLQERSHRLQECISKIEADLPQIVLEQQERLRERVASLLSEGTSLDPQRMEFEVALLADKCDVSEEVTRVKGHLMQFSKELMQEPSGSGKKLAFVTQELNREFNTIGSKIGNPALISVVIDAKSELEKVREQVANLE